MIKAIICIDGKYFKTGEKWRNCGGCCFNIFTGSHESLTNCKGKEALCFLGEYGRYVWEEIDAKG